MECKRNKWVCKEGGGCGCFHRRKVACLGGDEIERERRGIMVWSKWHHSGVLEMERAREGVAILLNDVCHSVVIEFGCVSSRILWLS